MPEPPSRGTRPGGFPDLRSRATSRLTGSAATTGSAARGADALSVLHGLASSPETAADALTLLHELQVHQIELEMQAQELHESRAELEQALRRQLVLYDFQPVGCFTIDARGVLQELNQTGAEMLGHARDEVYGLPLDAFFSVDSARLMRRAIADFQASGQQAACMLTLCRKAGPEQTVLATIGADPAGDGHLVSLMHLPQGPWPTTSAP